MDIKELIGKVIEKVEVNADRTALRLVTNTGASYYLITYGDCCSESWIEHVSGVESLIGSTITSIIDTTLGEVVPTRQQCDQLYSTKITHTGSYSGNEFYIEYRNSSNGYYGGCIDLYDTIPGYVDKSFKLLVDDF